jgi:uncharacterized protein (TIGR02145 family)
MKKPLFKRLGVITVVIACTISLTTCVKDNSPEPLNPTPINGISAAFVNLEETGVTIDEYTSQGRLSITKQSIFPNIRKGSIIVVDLDTMGYLRRVTSVKSDGDHVIMETSQAYLNDVFVDKDFKLNTALIDPDQVVSFKSIDKARNVSIIDEDGYIHPSEVILYDENGDTKIITANDLKSSKADTITLAYFDEDFSGKDLYGKEGDDIHFYISEGYAELGANAILEFDFNSNGEYDEDTEVERGDLNSFLFYLNSNADFQAKLELDAATKISKEDEKRLFKFKRVTAKFVVAGVPVWISLDVSIWGAYTFNADASLHADWGFETTNKLKVGGKYDGASNSFTPIHDFDSLTTIYPLNIDAEINLDTRLEIYPRVDVLIYNFFGPFAEIVPFVEGNFNAALKTNITQEGSETFVAWNSGIDVGLDLRIGAVLNFIGKKYDKEFGPTVIKCFEDTLWHSPASIDLLSTIPTECQSNTTIPLYLVVKDNLGNEVNLCPVYLSGNGSFSDEIVFSDSEGSINTNWLLSDNTSGLKEFSASIYDATGEIIDKVDGQTNEINSVTGIIFNPNLTYDSVTDIDGNVYKTIQIGSQTWMAENLKTTKLNDGSRIPLITDSWYYVETPCYSWYNNDSLSYNVYGVYYNWYTVKTGKLCPSGWHVPSRSEFETLISDTGGAEQAGGNLKESGFFHWKNPNTGANNIYGFSGLPAGYHGQNTSFQYLEEKTFFWSSVAGLSNNAWTISLEYSNSAITETWIQRNYGFTIRCIKNSSK